MTYLPTCRRTWLGREAAEVGLSGSFPLEAMSLMSSLRSGELRAIALQEMIYPEVLRFSAQAVLQEVNGICCVASGREFDDCITAVEINGEAAIHETDAFQTPHEVGFLSPALTFQRRTVVRTTLLATTEQRWLTFGAVEPKPYAEGFATRGQRPAIMRPLAETPRLGN